MQNALKVSAFILLIVVVIAGFASMIPQLESPAPEVLQIAAGLSGSELAGVGQTVYESPEASCTACHALGREGLRGPDLASIGALAAERVPGETSEVYLHKAIVEPCEHVVEGYDCLMPTTLMQTLGEAKVTALVAYLQSLGGEVTVAYTGDQSVEPADNGSTGSGVAGITAQEILTNAGCAGCHKIDANAAAQGIAPDLSSIGSRMSPDEIRQAILDPDAVVSAECPAKDEAGNQTTGVCPPGMMPKEYGQKLSAAQLETLVIFLTGLK